MVWFTFTVADDNDTEAENARLKTLAPRDERV